MLRWLAAPKRSAFAVVMALALCLPTAAAADSPRAGVEYTYTDTPITPTKTAIRGIHAAAVHFGRLPDCPDGIQFKLATYTVTALVVFGDPALTAAAKDCTIWTTPELLHWKARKRACTAIAHEVGHLLGLGHSERGLMVEWNPRVTPACR